MWCTNITTGGRRHEAANQMDASGKFPLPIVHQSIRTSGASEWSCGRYSRLDGNRGTNSPTTRSVMPVYFDTGVLANTYQGRHLRGLSPPRNKGKREIRKKKRKKEEKKKERKKGSMNNVKLLHIKCCFFQFFNSLVALKNFKNVGPQEKVEMTPLILKPFHDILNIQLWNNLMVGCSRYQSM